MARDTAYPLELPYYCTIKVHSLMCLELKKFVDRISKIYSDIEASRPRCDTGLQALCSLHGAMDKAKLLIQHCSDCSKLYLAFTADKILLRCEKIRTSLDLCLGQIQNMVPTLLAAKISRIIEDLRDAKFVMETSEEEAGKVVKELLRLDLPASNSTNDTELEALHFAAARLKITSRLAVLIEKRSIKKLHGKVRPTDPKKKILEYFMYLLRKYGGQIGERNTEDGFALQEVYQIPTENSATATTEPPLELKCPISKRLMFDPVIIDSGKTFERVWIEKWFHEGNNTCPVTNMRLENLYPTPNVAVKDLISKWCSDHGMTISEPSAQSIPAPASLQRFLTSRSIASIDSSMNDLHLQVSSVSIRSSVTNFGLLDTDENDNFGIELAPLNEDACMNLSAISGSGIILTSICKLGSLLWETQCKTVQNIIEHLNNNDKASNWIFDSRFIKPLIKFLMDAFERSDLKAQNDSADVLLSILLKSRVELPSLDKDAICSLASFIDSEISGKTLEIMEVLSSQPFYRSQIVASGVLPAILKALESQIGEYRNHAIKIIYNLSYNNDIAYHIVYLDGIKKLVPFLSDPSLVGYCLGIMNALCGIQEGMTAIAETNSCIASIAKLVETGTKQEQETAMEIVHSLCYEDAGLCQLAIGDSIIQSLFSVSGNGNSRRKIIATELLQLLGHTTEAAVSDISAFSSGISMSSDSGHHPKGRKSTSKGLAYYGKKLSRFFR